MHLNSPMRSPAKRVRAWVDSSYFVIIERQVLRHS
jgi:hypothetical protein